MPNGELPRRRPFSVSFDFPLRCCSALENFRIKPTGGNALSLFARNKNNWKSNEPTYEQKEEA